MKDRKKWWILPAALLAVFGLLMTGCPSGGGGNNNNTGGARELGTVFDLDDFLTNEMKWEVGKKGKGDAFWGKDNAFLTGAGNPNVEVIEKDGKRGLKFDTGGDNWGAGIDLKYPGFLFYGGDEEAGYGGDEITITGKVNKGDNWMLDSNIGSTSKPLGDLKWGPGEVSGTVTLTPEDVTRIMGTKPPAIRINEKPGTDSEIEVYTLVVKGWRPSEKEFVAVTDITGVVASAYVGKVTLAGTVEPSHATNQTIVWSLKDAGTTGVTAIAAETVDEKPVSTFTATAVGSVVVTATIANGATETTPYTKDFTIEITDPVRIKVKVAGVATDQEVVINGSSGTSVTQITNGYKVVINNYGPAASFKVNLGTGKKLSDFASVKLAYVGVEGDVGYKNVFLCISDTAFPADGLNSDHANVAVSGFYWKGDDTDPAQQTCTIGTQVNQNPPDTDRSENAAKTTASEVYVSVYLHASGSNGGKDTTYTVANVEFVGK